MKQTLAFILGLVLFVASVSYAQDTPTESVPFDPTEHLAQQVESLRERVEVLEENNRLRQTNNSLSLEVKVWESRLSAVEGRVTVWERNLGQVREDVKKIVQEALGPFRQEVAQSIEGVKGWARDAFRKLGQIVH